MIWAWLAGCGLGPVPEPVNTVFVGAPDPGEVQWTLEPTSLDLGETPVNQPASGVAILTNTGSVDLLVLDLGDAQEDDIEVSLADPPLLLPGSSIQLDVVWTPVTPGTLDSALSIHVGSSPEQAQPVTLRVGGTSLGATATVSTSSYDFGEVSVGCDDEFTLTLTNTGNIPMQVDSVGLEGEVGFWLDEPTDLPWVLAPFQSHEQLVRFSPEDVGLIYSMLSFETDMGEVETCLQGTGMVDEERTLDFDVREQSRATILFDVNETAIPNAAADLFSAPFVDALPIFFQTLLEYRASFRAAFVWSVQGTVDGEYDYIDETFTASEATEAALAMLAPGIRGGDNDANFSTLQNAIHANRDWLFEDAGWSGSRLSLITIQRDTEASGGSWTDWVNRARASKEDPADVIFHAIAGPLPRGCSGADPFMDYDEAVSATGGMLLSVCEPDWTDHMAKLATASVEGLVGIFQLEGLPIKSSIRVSVDGLPADEGWSYDGSLNAVVFEEYAYPLHESIVTVYYWMSEDCG